jgi:hypothetical protein
MKASERARAIACALEVLALIDEQRKRIPWLSSGR